MPAVDMYDVFDNGTSSDAPDIWRVTALPGRFLPVERVYHHRAEPLIGGIAVIARGPKQIDGN